MMNKSKSPRPGPKGLVSKTKPGNGKITTMPIKPGTGSKKPVNLGKGMKPKVMPKPKPMAPRNTKRGM